MKKTSFLAAIALAIALPSNAQTLKAKVAESDSITPCVAATYKIYNAADTSKFVVAAITDEKGDIYAKLPKFGKYMLKVEYFGMQPQKRFFGVDKTNPEVDLGVMVLKSSVEALKEVTIMGYKKVVENDGEKVTYNLEEDPQSKGSTLLEMLRKVPMVTVDGDDNIQVNGESNFKIYVNGKPDPMLSKNAKELLKAMPASAIKKIEVMTDPGAKFDAEGSGGILNFVTQTKQALDGYLMNLSASLNNNYGSLSGYFRTKIDKVTADINASYTNSLKGNEQNGLVRSIFDEGSNSDISSQIEELQIKNKFKMPNVGMNFSWEPDTLNLLTAGLSFSCGKFVTDGNSVNMAMTRLNPDQQAWSYNRELEFDVSMTGVNANFSYQRNLGKEGHHIVASYLFNFDDQDARIENHYGDFVNYSLANVFLGQKMISYDRQHTVQVDYSNPFAKGHLMETGVKGQFGRNSGKSNNTYIPYTTPETLMEGDYIDMSQYKDIMAIYASYTGTVGKLKMKGGLRYEYTRMGIHFKKGGGDDISSTLNDLVPNVSLTYNMRQAENIRLFYRMRISRPSIDQLSPFSVEVLTPTIQQGNPDLKSEQYHYVGITYSNYAGALYGNITAQYSQINNSIYSVNRVIDGKVISRPENLGQDRTIWFTGYLGWKIIPGMNLGVNASTQYDSFKASEFGIYNHGWSANFSANWDYSIKAGFRFSTNFYAGTRRIDVMGTRSGYKGMSLSVSKSFINKSLDVTLFGSNILWPNIVFDSVEKFEGGQTYLHAQSPQWRVGVSVSYRLGTLSKSVKKTGANLESDNASEGKGGKGGLF